MSSQEPRGWHDPEATRPLRPVRSARSAGLARGTCVLIGVLTLMLVTAAVLAAVRLVDGSGDGGPVSAPGQPRTGLSPLGCEIVPLTIGSSRTTQVVPSWCTAARLGALFCGARDPVEYLGTAGDLRGRGGRGQTVDGFRDPDGRSFQKVFAIEGDPATVSSYLLCDDGRTLPVTEEENRTLITVGDGLPSSLSAKIRDGGAGVVTEPPPGSAGRAGDASRTVVGGGDPQACYEELSGLLRDVVSGRVPQDEAEARIPDAAGTLALRSAVDGVSRYRTDGLSEQDAVQEATAAFTFVCGER